GRIPFVLSVDVKCRSRRDKASRVLRFDFAATTATLSANEYRANSVRGGTSCASFPRRRESNASVVCFGVQQRDTGDSGFRREELRRPRNGGQIRAPLPFALRGTTGSNHPFPVARRPPTARRGYRRAAPVPYNESIGYRSSWM